jgi:hypothetical protein
MDLFVKSGDIILHHREMSLTCPLLHFRNCCNRFDMFLMACSFACMAYLFVVFVVSQSVRLFEKYFPININEKSFQ